MLLRKNSFAGDDILDPINNIFIVIIFIVGRGCIKGGGGDEFHCAGTAPVMNVHLRELFITLFTPRNDMNADKKYTFPYL